MSTLSVDTIQGQTTVGNVKLPANYIIQVQSGQLTTQCTKNSSISTYSDTGLSVTITPKYSNSKIHVHATGNTYATADSDTPLHRIIRTVGGTATSIAATDYMCYSGHGGGTGGAYVQSVIDTAQSTAAHEYKIQIRGDVATENVSHIVYFNVRDNGDTGTANEAQLSTITVMEIAQ